MIIDAHVHANAEGFFPSRWFEYAAYQWAYARFPRRDPAVILPKIEPGVIDPDGSILLGDMDAAGVDVAVLMTIDWGPEFDADQRVTIEDIHRHTAALAKRHPTRLVAFAGVDPRRPNATQLVEWAFLELGMKGLKLHPPSGFYPYDRSVYPLLEICDAWAYPVTVHTGEALPILPLRFSNPLFVQDAQVAFPGLRIWLAHAGHRLYWDEALSVAAHGVDSYLELSAWITDETTEEEQDLFVRRLVAARDRIGAHRLVFGTDRASGPRGNRISIGKAVAWYQDLPRKAKSFGLRFSEDEVELVLGGNAARCLTLAVSPTRPKTRVAPSR